MLESYKEKEDKSPYVWKHRSSAHLGPLPYTLPKLKVIDPNVFFCKVSPRGTPYPIVNPLRSIYYTSKISVPSLY